MLTLLRDVIVLLSGGLTWEPGVRELSGDLPLSPRLQATTNVVSPSLAIPGAVDAPGTALPVQ